MVLVRKFPNTKARLARATCIPLICLGCLISQSGFGQSDNYWSWSSNTHATLLAGAVVGGVSGPSSIYYNPALIDHDNLSSLAASANLLSFQFYKVENIAGDNLNADEFLFKVQPRFISYVVDNNNDRLGVQFALMSPISEKMEYTGQYETELNIIDRTAGVEQYNGYLHYQRNYDDTWGGMGVSYELTDQLYVGASLFLSYKSLDMNSTQAAEAFQFGDSVTISNSSHARYIATSGFEEEFSYWYFSSLIKLGVQYTLASERLSFGLTLNMPDIPIYGESKVRKRYYRGNIYNDSEGEFVSNENTLAVERRNDIRIKSPFSVAMGGAYYTKDKSNVVLITAEYFSQIDAYHIVKSEKQADWIPGHINKVLGENSFMSYGFQARPVTNVALGFKSELSDKLSFLGGARTDFTVGRKSELRYVSDLYGVNQMHINKWHLTSGLLFEISRFKFLTGLQYTYARSEEFLQATNYTSPVEYNPISDQSLDGTRKPVASAALNELTLFFGFSIGVK